MTEKHTKLDRNIFIYSFRYAMNRQTYAMSDVMDKFNEMKESFENWELKSMVEELSQCIKLSDSCDLLPQYVLNERIGQLKTIEDYYNNRKEDKEIM